MPDEIHNQTLITLDGHLWQIQTVNWEEMTVELERADGRTSQTVSFNAIWGTQNTPTSEPDEDHPGMLTDLPVSLLDKASTVIHVVEFVEKALATEERRAHQQAIPFRHTETLKQILRQLHPSVGMTSYYKYRSRYHEYAGDRARIAASFRRATLNQSRMKPALYHLVDQIVLRYGTRQPPRTPRNLYRLLCATLERTGNRWINPEKCIDGHSEQLVTLLFDVTIPMTSILNQVEHVEMLEVVTPPSESWFYGYWRWFQT